MEPNNPNTGMQGSGNGSVGPVVALIIILAVIILGGLYFWGQRSENTNTDIYGNQVNSGENSDEENLTGESSSDDTAAIEADLEATNTSDLDSELNAS
jgi:hypothetical protein